jgi:hypothetical protein
MHRTTVYLPDDLRRAIKEVARSEEESEATFIRRALERAVSDARPPRPRLPLFSSGDESLADNVDEALTGFGES